MFLNSTKLSLNIMFYSMKKIKITTMLQNDWIRMLVNLAQTENDKRKFTRKKYLKECIAEMEFHMKSRDV